LNTGTHIIEKVVVEVNTTQVKTANTIKNNLDAFLKNEIFPKLEKLLQKYDRPGSVVRFQELELNLDLKNGENLKKVTYEILAAFEEQLRKKVVVEESPNQMVDFNASQDENYQQEQRSLNPQNQDKAFLQYQRESRNITVTRNEEEIFLFFLENGFLPWYGNQQQLASFQKKKNWQISFKDPNFVQALKGILSKDERLFVRFFYQFPVEMVVTFISKINAGLSRMKSQMLKVLAPMQPNLQLEFLSTLYFVSVEKKNDRVISVIQHWLTLLQQNKKYIAERSEGMLSGMGKLLLRAAPKKIVSDEKFQEILNDNLAFISGDKFPDNEYAILYEDKVKLETFLSEKIKAKKDSRPSFFDKDMQEIAVQNAGIVILHPFLKHFFTLVKIVNKLGKVIPAKRELAVQTLHFLATGNEEFFEGNLVLEKFLCGLPLHSPIQKESLLTPEIKAEAEILLKEVVKNWSALKHTSPDGLRQMFLQRDGKLIQNDKNFKLIIERKTQDILLDKLGWNISVIKLKWLTEMLFVDW